MARVVFDEVTVAVDGDVVLDDVSLDIAHGEVVGVIGPSGSGKTTLIRTIAGFTDIVRGHLFFDDIDVTTMRTADRDVAMVFEEPALFRSRNVRRTVAFPLEIRKQAPEEIRHRVDAEIRAMHLEHLLGRQPHELSRGEAQLVQIARALVRAPRVLLLDDPLATLDTVRHEQMRSELAVLQAGYGVTTVIATNDPADAMQLSSRLVVLDAGRVVQFDTSWAVRRAPATLDAAAATGDCWRVTATVSADTAGGFWLTVGGRGNATGRTAMRHRAWSAALQPYVGRQVTLGVRPEDVVVSSAGAIQGEVCTIVPGSPHSSICDVAGWRLGFRHEPEVRLHDLVRLRLDHLVVFDSTTGRAIA